MIHIKTPAEIEEFKVAGSLSKAVLRRAGRMVRPGVTTREIDQVVESFIRLHGAVPGFKGLYGFPASICASVNGEIVHGIPSPMTFLNDGDIISIDTGATIDGWVGDNAWTFYVGTPSTEVQGLCEVSDLGPIGTERLQGAEIYGAECQHHVPGVKQNARADIYTLLTGCRYLDGGGEVALRSRPGTLQQHLPQLGHSLRGTILQRLGAVLLHHAGGKFRHQRQRECGCVRITPGERAYGVQVHTAENLPHRRRQEGCYVGRIYLIADHLTVNASL